jgi:serine protein kinase
MLSQEFLKHLSNHTTKHHHAQKHILTFDAYLEDLLNYPERHLRNANIYILEALTWAQKNQNLATPSHAFEKTTDTHDEVFGQEDVIEKLIHAVEAAMQEGVPHRMLLLHGPNGSGKSSILKKLKKILEIYSATDEGALYTFNWIFPTKDLTGSKLGIGTESSQRDHATHSFAHLPPNQIQCIIRSEMHEPPSCLIPTIHRTHLWESFSQEKISKNHVQYLKQFFTTGALSIRNQSITDTLLDAYEGNIEQVLQHIQVQRFYLNEKQMTGLVSIHPADSTHAILRQITVESNYQQLPPILQSINLYEMQGELIAGNRGVVEFNDLFKRPIESFKYLLTACETGQVHVGPLPITLDTLFIGSCNEKQIEAFKEYPDFSSFKARFELIPTPLLLNYKKETQIYTPLIQQLESTKPFTRHAAQWMALWAVMTRLKKPNSNHLPEKSQEGITKLTPLEKAYLYAGEIDKCAIGPTDDNRKITLTLALQRQYRNEPLYEGRLGISPREMKQVIMAAYKRAAGLKSVPLYLIIDELKSLIQRTSEFDFLKQDPDGNYQSPTSFIDTIQNSAVEDADQCFRAALGVYDEAKIDAYLEKYFSHISHHLKKENFRNPETGQHEPPDQQFIEAFEKRAQATDATSFRDNIMNTFASAPLDKEGNSPHWSVLFSNLRELISKSFYDEIKPELLQSLEAALNPTNSSFNKGLKQKASNTQKILKEKYHYHYECLDEALAWLHKKYST